MAFRNSTAVIVCAFSSIGLLSAATPGIGIAMSQGNILINSSQTAGNATIFDGSTVETQSASSQVRLNGGAQLRLSSDSRGTVFTDHVNLQKGSARIAGYAASASGLNVRADRNSSATVSMRDQGVIEIAALSGSVHIFNAAGMNVANLLPGRALDLRPQDAGASAPSSLVGCAVKAGGNTILTDETSNVTVQLKGSSVRTGRRVQISGTMVPNSTPPSPATQVINVTSVKQVGGPCKAGTAAAAAGGAAAAGAGGAAAGAAAGISTTTAVVAGVAAAAAVAVGGTAAAGGFSSNNPTVSSGRLGAFN
ncbi:MAG TPA: hypothetical protein VHZ74_24815 [Bryobacteraceae bacterium]|nr:hypothetical protein [Bryobacteraceae bacterium]